MPSDASITPSFASVERQLEWRRPATKAPPITPTTPEWGRIKITPLSSSPPNIEWRRSAPLTSLPEAQNWRAPASPSSSLPRKALNTMGMPTFENVKVGQVFKLPSKEDIPEDSVFHKIMGVRLDHPYGHPLVVLSKEPLAKKVTFRILTSFSNATGSCGLPANKSLASRSRIALCDNLDSSVLPHNKTRLLTVAAGSDKFKKATYLNFADNELQIEYDYIKPWTTGNGKPIAFD